MFHGMVMNVIDVPRKINLIPELMFPIPPLPDAALTLGLAAGSMSSPFASRRENTALMSDQRNG